MGIRIFQQLRARLFGRRPTVVDEPTVTVESAAAPTPPAPADAPRPIFGEPPGLLERGARRPLKADGPLPGRTTHLLPRMVARIGNASFAGDRYDFVEELPELRTLERSVSDDEAEQVGVLATLTRDYARSHPPDPASFPALALRVMERASDRRARTDDLVSMVAQDAAIAASLLRIANSPRYHRGGPPIAQLKIAVAQLGLDEVRRIAAAVASRSLYDLEAVATYSLFKPMWDGMFHRSMTVAFTAGWLAGQLKTGTAERAFLGGMFHDIGKTLALRSIAALQMAGQLSFEPLPSAMDAAMESLHVELGVRMHESWGLPDDLALICRMHHEWAPPAEPELRTLHVVRLCSALADLRAAPALHTGSADMVRNSVKALQIQFKQYRLLTARLNGFAEQVSALFHLEEVGSMPLPEDGELPGAEPNAAAAAPA